MLNLESYLIDKVSERISDYKKELSEINAEENMDIKLEKLLKLSSNLCVINGIFTTIEECFKLELENNVKDKNKMYSLTMNLSDILHNRLIVNSITFEALQETIRELINAFGGQTSLMDKEALRNEIKLTESILNETEMTINSLKGIESSIIVVLTSRK